VLAALNETQRDPAAFAAALEQYACRVRGLAPSSAPPGHHDLFHDFVGRHRTTSQTAFRCRDGGRFVTLTYRELDARSAELATAWLQAGVLPASRVCLLGELDTTLVVALAACFRLGALPALLPARSRRFVAARLDAFDPSFVYANASAVAFVPAARRVALLDFALGARPFLGSHAYAAERPALFVFAPLRPGKLPRSASALPAPLSAAAQRTAALRDGLLVYALEPGRELAAPGFSALQCQPALLLAALAAGATYVQLSRAQALAEPALLATLDCLGLDLDLCDACARRGVRPVARSWFRNPEEPLDWAAWSSALERTGLDGAFGTNVLLDATLGGAVLASVRTRRSKASAADAPAAHVHASRVHAAHVHAEVLPAAGLATELRDLGDPERVAHSGVGLLAIGDGELAAPPYVVLATSSRPAALYAGTLSPRRVGAVVPCAELESAVCRVSGVLGAAVLPVLASSPQRFELFVFVTPPADDAQAAVVARQHAEALQARLAAEFPPEELPDRVECLFVRPPLGSDGALDVDRCQAGVITGSLFRKARTPAFRRLARLHATLFGAPEGVEEGGEQAGEERAWA
jgi:hypothetical protein